MYKPRIIIADTDVSYLIPLQLKFLEFFFDKIDIEIITDKTYYNNLFGSPQKADILIVAEELYDKSLQRHNIGKIFMMTEKNENEETGDLNINKIFKYSSTREILNEIIGKSGSLFKFASDSKKETQIILVYSACGGVGKTTVSVGISACLTKNYKRVLYINADHLQTFHRILDNKSAISSSDIYTKIAMSSEQTYNDIKHVIRQEIFSYLPPFKSSLMSLGLSYSVYEKIALGAKKSSDYDYIIIDADATFDEEKANLINIADKVIIITKQNESAIFATNLLIANINGSSSEKYLYICNDFNKEIDNALVSSDINMKFTISDYVDHFSHYDKMKLTDFSKEGSIQRVTFLII